MLCNSSHAIFREESQGKLSVFSVQIHTRLLKGEECPNHACKYRRFIFTLYFIYLTIILLFIKLLCNYINENLEKQLSIPRYFKSTRVDVHRWLTVVRCIFLRQGTVHLKSCIEVGWIHVTATLCWGESNSRR